MEVFDCITSRRSIRKFKDQPVEWYLIGKILYAGFYAPTAGNLQDFRFMVVTDPSLKQGLAQAALNQSWMLKAPVIIVVFSEFVKSKRFYGIRGERLYTIQDSAAAAQNILLAAHDVGLGGCWVGAFDEDKVCSVLGIPDYARPQAIIPIGFPDEEPPVPPKYKLENVVFFNRWADNAGKTKDIAAEILKDWAPGVERGVKGAAAAIQKGGQTLSEKITGKAKELHGKIKDSVKKNKDKK